MMRKNRLLTMLLMVVSIFSVAWAEDSSTQAFRAYSSAYQAYQSAIARQAPAAEIEKALRDYQVAKETYIQSLPSAGAGTALASTGSHLSSADAGASDDSASTLGIPDSPNQSSATGFRDDDPATFSANIQQLMNALKARPSQQYAEAIVGQITAYLAANPNLPDRSRIKYELAKACDEVLGSRALANKLYQEVADDPDSGRWGIYAKLRIKYNNAMGDRLVWKKSVNDKAAAMNEAFKKYKETSWLALPVKLARWTRYLATSVSFIRAQNKESDFQLWFEEMGAPFAPPVDKVFDEYQSVNDNNGLVSDDQASIKLLYNNYDAWYARWKFLSEARESIDIQYFIIENDIFGYSFLGHLVQKARQGVKIRLMVDARGTTKFATPLWARDYLRVMLRFPNVEIKVYNPIQSNLVSMFTDIRRIVSSNHDKIVVVDGRYAIIGGRNIADEYLVDPIDDKAAWLDCDVVIDSEAVAGQLDRAFVEEFSLLKAYEVGKDESHDSKLRLLDAAYTTMNAALNRRPLLNPAKAGREIADKLKEFNDKLTQYKNMIGYPTFDPFGSAHRCPVKILDKHSLSGPRNDITEALIRFIDGSKKEIIIQNPYIVLTPRAEAALKRAARRGVPIYIHTNSPETSDSFPTEGIIMSEWRTMLKNMPTCRMFARVSAGQLHAKNFVFDGQISIIGTYNFDFLSEKVNSEVVAVIKSVEFAREVRRDIMAAMAKSKEYRLATATTPEFGPENIESKKMWLVKLCSKLGFLKPLF